jgi:hypothetical protein
MKKLKFEWKKLECNPIFLFVLLLLPCVLLLFSKPESAIIESKLSPQKNKSEQNLPLIITSLPDPNGHTGSKYVSKIKTNNRNSDQLIYQLENAPEGLVIGVDGTLTWEHPVQGRYTVIVIITDSAGIVTQRQFHLLIH